MMNSENPDEAIGNCNLDSLLEVVERDFGSNTFAVRVSIHRKLKGN